MKNNMQIQTVKGLEEVKNTIIADSHVHIWAKNTSGRNSETSGEVSDLRTIMACLKDFKSAGGSLLVDCTPYGCGRDGNVLYDISEDTGVYVVCVTGFHLKKYYFTYSQVWESDMDEVFDFFVSEIEHGLKETLNRKIKIKPGAIKIPFTGNLDGPYAVLTEAAIRASLETGVPLLVHTEKGLNVEWFSDFLEKKGINPQKVVFCHVDKRNDISLHKELALRGYYLEYDTFLRDKYEPRKNVYMLIDKMLEKGLKDSIMIGTDIADNAMWESVSSGTGYGSFFDNLKNYLSKKYRDADVVSSLMGTNTARFLSVK